MSESLTAATLFLYAIVVSQPFFYRLALGDASTALSATAYIEFRHQINRAIVKRLVRLYAVTLVTTLGLGVHSAYLGARVVAAGAGLAAVAVIVDAILSVRLNVPINTAMNAWTTTDYPDDWANHRARWNEAFALRQGVLTTGFVALVLAIALTGAPCAHGGCGGACP